VNSWFSVEQIVETEFEYRQPELFQSTKTGYESVVFSRPDDMEKRNLESNFLEVFTAKSLLCFNKVRRPTKFVKLNLIGT
jgi:hypothetical protein